MSSSHGSWGNRRRHHDSNIVAGIGRASMAARGMQSTASGEVHRQNPGRCGASENGREPSGGGAYLAGPGGRSLLSAVNGMASNHAASSRPENMPAAALRRVFGSARRAQYVCHPKRNV